VLPLLLAAAALAAPAKKTVLFLGDSLTAGYGVSPEEAYPALIDEDWRKRGLPLEARDAGVSGATTADALSNLDWTLTPDVKLVFLEIGANDGLRGLPVASAQKNIGAIIEACRKKRIPVALAGMKVPPNYGAAYSKAFEAMYPKLAKKYRVKLMPFLLEGVAGDPKLTQPDGLHPTAEGHKRIAADVETFLEKNKLLP
jgi:acyl-CoA thioesterase-1